jgi:beta-mannosidase
MAAGETTALGPHRLPLVSGWEVARSAADACDRPGGPDGPWRPAAVPGTAAGALGPEAAAGTDFDAEDWWFRVRFTAEAAGAGEEVALCLGGIATVAEVYLNGHRVLDSESMFAAHELDVGDLLRGDNELAICCRALGPRLAIRRRPRARWRTKLVAEGNLRFYRTMLLGRAPGFAPGPAVVGPWRPVELERRRGLILERVRLRSRLAGEEGRLEVSAGLRAPVGVPFPDRLTVQLGGRGGAPVAAELAVRPVPGGGAVVTGALTLARPELWWPHTHGRPALYDVRIGPADDLRPAGRIGFRRLQAAADLLGDGPALEINGIPVFLRGAVWTPLELARPYATEPELRGVLTRLVEGGMNALRVAGIGAYESPTFHDLCDELGILVWQDFMFANFDYPEQDGEFMAAAEGEARAVLDALAGRPSLAVLCGGSEVAQQVAMLGLDPALADGPLYGELLPRLVREAGVEAPYLPSAPWGGDLPFRTDRGIANYYGVGAYRRPLEDARRAEVRMAAECLAFANVPDEAALEALAIPGQAVVHDPAWKAGVPRDVGAGWDFDDVRDHYLQLLFGVDPVGLRSSEPERYLELSRAVSGEVMAEVLGEWRRDASPCRGAFILWAKDLVAGAGWGILDHRGQPKVAYHHLRRALAPVAVWSTDEGLGGIVAHIANDDSEVLRARLRVSLYRGFRQLGEEVIEDLELPAHGQAHRNVEALLGRFVDISGAYGFGPVAHDLVALTLEREVAAHELLSQSFRCVGGRPLAAAPASALGLTATVIGSPGEGFRLVVSSEAFAYGVRVSAPGYLPDDDAFSIEPGHSRELGLTAVRAEPTPPAGTLTGLNLAGRLRFAFS